MSQLSINTDFLIERFLIFVVWLHESPIEIRLLPIGVVVILLLIGFLTGIFLPLSFYPTLWVALIMTMEILYGKKG